MAQITDTICPDFFGDENISIELLTEDALLAGTPVTVGFSYDDVGECGLIPPIDVFVKHLKSGSLYSHTKKFSDFVPESYTFKAGDSGTYLITIRERYHNCFWGRLIIEVQGDQYSNVLSGGRI